jgi:AraC-like DNA-binding protein
MLAIERSDIDPLTEVLQSVRLRGTMHGRFELSAPWGLRLEGNGPLFYVVVRGHCYLHFEDDDLHSGRPVRVEPGDFVLLPVGRRHVLRDDPSTRAASLAEATGMQTPPFRTLRFGGGGPGTTLVYGAFAFEHGGHNPFVEALPSMIHLHGDRDVSVGWRAAVAQLIAAEASSNELGARTIVSRFADILFIDAVRTHFAQSSGTTRGLRAMIDRQIGPALAAVHQHPEHRWTVASLASHVAMSRSTFAARFTELVGAPPLSYITRCRLQKAAGLLRGSGASISEIAGQVGYEAEAALSKAFKREFGVSPGAYRKANGPNANELEVRAFGRSDI